MNSANIGVFVQLMIVNSANIGVFVQLMIVNSADIGVFVQLMIVNNDNISVFVQLMIVNSAKKSLKIPKGNQNPNIEEEAHNGQKKKYKRTNNDQQSIHIKLKIK